MTMSGQAITKTKASAYMREWMDLHTIDIYLTTDNYLYGTAKNRMDEQKQYRIERYPDSEQQYNVLEKPMDSEQEWEWVDAINVE